jgi:uncharacterized membrane protein
MDERSIMLMLRLIHIVGGVLWVGGMVLMAGFLQAAGAPPSAEQSSEMAALQARVGRGMQAVTVLLLIAAAAMATARYL